MAEITSHDYQGRHLRLVVNESSYSVENNTSNVSWTLYSEGGSSSYYTTGPVWVKVNGQEVWYCDETSYRTREFPAATGSVSGTVNNIPHDDSTGEKTISFELDCAIYNTNVQYFYGSLTLTKIPRKTTINTFTVDKVNETSLKFNWSAADTVDYVWYSTNNGSSWTGLDVTDGKSGNFNVTGLSAGTTYNCKLRVRRKDSQQTTDSSAVSQTTYSYPYVQTVGTAALTIGNSQTLTLYNPLGRSTTVYMKKDSTSGTQFYSGTTTGTSITFTPTANTMYASIPNNQSGNCVYYCTYSGHTSATKSGTFKIVGNEKPTFNNFTYADINNVTTALTGNNQILIKGYSNVRATVSVANKAVANNSATMKSYTFTNGSKSTTANYSSNADVTMDITGIENNTLTVSATDSRSLSKAVTKTATIKNYSNVTISSVTAVRGSNGVGKDVTLTFSGTFWNESFGSVTNDFNVLKYQYKLTTSNTWIDGTTTLTATKSGNNYSGSFSIKGDLGAEGFDVANSYNIRLVVTDKLSTQTYNVTLGSGTPGIAVYKNKVAIGQKYDTTGTEALQVNGDVNATGVIKEKKYQITPIDITGTTNTLLSRIKALGTNGIMEATWLSKTDGGTSGISDKPTGTTNAGFVCNAICNRWASNSDYRYIVNCYVQGENSYYNAVVTNASTSISWSRPIARVTMSSKTHSNYNNYQNYLATMSCLTYWNGAFNSSNSSNLTYAHQGVIQCKPTNLYNNTSGNNGSVTLSQSTANFSYIEILHSDNNNAQFKTTRIYSPNGKNIVLFCIEPGGGNMYFRTSMYDVSGTSITFKKGTFMQVNGGSIAANYEAQFIKIFRVDGYK